MEWIEPELFDFTYLLLALTAAGCAGYVFYKDHKKQQARKMYEESLDKLGRIEEREKAENSSSGKDSAAEQKKPRGENIEADKTTDKPSAERKRTEDLDALELMKRQLISINDFSELSKSQSKSAFRLAVSMCVAGIILLAAAILLPLFMKTSFEQRLLPAIGGIVGEFIAITALAVHKKSISQLNYYHHSLHENERFLVSVNLLDRFSTLELSDEMLKELIQGSIQLNQRDMGPADED